MNYTRNWTKKVRQNFGPLKDRLPRPLRLLEIGVWEGRSALWMLDNLGPAEYIGIDPWDIAFLDQKKFPPTEEGRAKGRAIEELARANLAPLANARLIKGSSQIVLVDPQYADIFRPESFGFVYIDGMHTYAAVMADACNVWPLVQVGGVVVWDDCITRCNKEGRNIIQKAADNFMLGKPHEVLFRGAQFGVMKQ